VGLHVSHSLEYLLVTPGTGCRLLPPSQGGTTGGTYAEGTAAYEIEVVSDHSR